MGALGTDDCTETVTFAPATGVALDIDAVHVANGVGGCGCGATVVVVAGRVVVTVVVVWRVVVTVVVVAGRVVVDAVLAGVFAVSAVDWADVVVSARFSDVSTVLVPSHAAVASVSRVRATTK
jgi:hypothetical protein